MQPSLTQQPEITFILKLCRIRNGAEKRKGNHRIGVMADVDFFEKHISANGYKTRTTASSLLKRKVERVRRMIPQGKLGLERELEDLLNLKN